jgi:4-hydroxy-2-oxoheptanedioate aldolase
MELSHRGTLQVLKNKMKAKIKAGEPVFGISIMFPSPHLVEIIGLLGFDWVLIDCEHGSMTAENVEVLALAAERHGMAPIVRPEVNRPDLIAKYLDRGCQGVQIPHVITREDAERAVRAVKFAPEGMRGLARGTRAGDYGFLGDGPDMVKALNDETLICVQIEDREALDNLDDILKTDGVDVFFVGPSDLSQSLGHPGDRSHPEVQSAIEAAFAKIHAAGKASGTPGEASAAAEHVKQGILYHYTHSQNLIAASGRAYLKAVGRD